MIHSLDNVGSVIYPLANPGCEGSVVLPINVQPNQAIGFGLEHASSDALKEGWSTPEHGQVWSDGPHALISLRLERIPHGSVLIMKASPFLLQNMEFQRIFIFANGLYVATKFLKIDGEIAISLQQFISVSVMMSGSLDLAFSIPDCSPGSGSDQRKLGFALHSLELRHS